MTCSIADWITVLVSSMPGSQTKWRIFLRSPFWKTHRMLWICPSLPSLEMRRIRLFLSIFADCPSWISLSYTMKIWVIFLCTQTIFKYVGWAELTQTKLEASVSLVLNAKSSAACSTLYRTSPVTPHLILYLLMRKSQIWVVPGSSCRAWSGHQWRCVVSPPPWWCYAASAACKSLPWSHPFYPASFPSSKEN